MRTEPEKWLKKGEDTYSDHSSLVGLNPIARCPLIAHPIYSYKSQWTKGVIVMNSTRLILAVLALPFIGAGCLVFP